LVAGQVREREIDDGGIPGVRSQRSGSQRIGGGDKAVHVVMVPDENPLEKLAHGGLIFHKQDS